MFLKEFELGSIRDSHNSSSMTPIELRNRIGKRRDDFFHQGLRPESRVLLFSGNSIEFFIDLLALWDLGVCAAVMDSATHQEMKDKLAKSLAVSAILSPGKNLKALPKIGATLSLPEQSALVLFTSGTTGLPRGVVHSFDSLQKKMRVLSEFIPPSEIQKTLCALPTSFGHGLICNSLFPLLSGAELFLEERFSPFFISKLSEFCAHFEINFFSSTPTVWNLIQELSKHEKSLKLKRVHCASAPLDRKRIQYMKNWNSEVRFFNVYGLTEFLGWVSGHEISSDDGASCVGEPWGIEWKLSNHEAPHILLKSDFMFKGYLEQMDHGYTFQEQKEIYFDSEDLGEFTAENEMLIRGRSRLVINKAGLKIRPEEIEFWAHEMPFVSEACCFPLHDDLLGHKLGLAVVLQESRSSQQEWPIVIRNEFHQKVPPYKVPDQVWILPEMPRTARGKIDRKGLLELIQKGEGYGKK